MNKKSLFLLLMITTILFGAQVVTAEGSQETSGRSISVVGRGSVSATPDIVSLNLGVQSNDTNLNTAIEDNNNRIAKIITVIEEFGIAESDYRTSNFSVYYQQPYGEDLPDGTYNVNNNIFIEVNEISIIGKFIEQALNAGANQFYGLEYGISTPAPLMKEARELAVQNAITLAGETAGYAGLKLGKIISIEETPYYGGDLMYGAEMSRASNSNGITTIPGEKAIEVQINMKIELK